MKTTTEKPEPFVCPECHQTTQPQEMSFRPGYWLVIDSCPLCEQQRRDAEDREKNKQVIDRMTAQVDSILLSRCGCTPKLLQASIAQVPEKLRQLFNSPAGAYVYGPPGTGKSFLFAALIRQQALDKIGRARDSGVLPDFRSLPYFVNVHDLMRRLQKASIGQGDDGETESSVLNLFSNSPILVMDDLGVRRSSEFAENCLYEIINSREQYLRPTFFTANYSLGDLASRIESRTVSRIAGMTTGRVFFLGGADRRLKTKDL
jgi:DNA replication protein DnaC